MQNKILFTAAAVAALLMSGAASAALVTSGSGAISDSDPTQTNRLLRNGVASTWAAPKAFPGTSAQGTTFHDEIAIVFAANASQDVYYEITYSNLDAFTPHLVAYLDSFVATTISTHYLGDTGNSAGPGSPRSMQVIVPAGHSLVLNFESVAGNGSFGRYEYTVNAFSDANRGENFGVPEPTTLVLFGLAATAMGATRRRKSA